jgi:hypothetical protein
MRYLFAIIAAMLFAQGCNAQMVGLTSGYNQLSETEKADVLFNTKDICDMPNDHKIVAINGKQLKECLAQTDSAMVYRWVPHCNGKACVPLNVCRAYAARHNLKLYIVAEEYDYESMQGQNSGDKPVFVIDHKHYKANLRSRYSKKFARDLMGDAISKDRELYYALFMVFHKDQFVRTIPTVLEPINPESTALGK